MPDRTLAGTCTRRARRALIALLVAAVVAPLLSANAQLRGSIHGVVVATDGDRAHPVESTEVQLIATDSLGDPLDASGVGRWTEAEESGHFRFPDVPPGTYRLRARRLGYEPVEGWLVLRPGQVFRPTLTMEPMVVRLAEVVTTASRSAPERLLERAGFVERRKIGFGTFLGPETLDFVRGRSVADALRPYIRGCSMMYMNGARAKIPPGLTMAEVAGVEVYTRELQTPAEFRASAPACGSIVIWTSNPE